MAIITHHAVERYRLRFEDIDEACARAVLERHAPAIAKAAAFGCSRVKVGGMILALEGEIVTTVLFSGPPHASRTMLKKWRRSKAKA